MQVSSLYQPGQDANLVVSPKNTPVLQNGEIVHAEVLTATETNVAIRMKGTILEARTNVPLMEGESIALVVDGQGEETRLRLLQRGVSDADFVKNTILSVLNTLKGLRPAAEDIHVLRAVIAGMQDELKESLPGLRVLEQLLVSPEGLSGDVLKNLLQNSGVFFETKLRVLIMAEGREKTGTDSKLRALMDGDMKAALLRLKEALEGNEAAGRLLRQSGVRTDTLASVLDNLLRHIEAQQLQSKLNDTFQVFAPFVWRDLKDGELIFRESDGNRAGEKAYSCMVNLDLEQAGRVSARVLMQSGRIHVDFIAENTPFFCQLQDGLASLRQIFETVGIIPGHISVSRRPAIDFKTACEGKLDIFA